MIYPKKLSPEGTIGLICPSSPISKEREAKCVNLLEDLGYRVKAAANLTENYAGYMAGEGTVRAQWINAMFADPEVDAIFCIRGGDGGHRAMPHVDLNIVKDNPKIFVGYSDVTSLHLAFNQKCQMVTFHGPMVSSNMVDHLDEETKASFFGALNADCGYRFVNPQAVEIKALKAGKAKGVLTGGNLALLSASMGTPYELDTKGKILFIEEVGETMSRIDRFAWQLLNSGKLQECAGIILGQFTDCTNEENPAYTYLELFQDLLAGLDIPVLYDVQAGHDHPNMTLPLGAECTIDTTDNSITFADPVR